jgi:hypothetical protein
VLPSLWIAGDTLHDLLGKRKPFLTANRLLSNQTFRDIYRTDTLDVDQGLKITSLTFLFTDLKGSTALYERVGDLVAYALVRAREPASLSSARKPGGRFVHRKVTSVPPDLGSNVISIVISPSRAGLVVTNLTPSTILRAGASSTNLTVTMSSLSDVLPREERSVGG